MNDDEYMLPADDVCAGQLCGKSEAEHAHIHHSFIPPERKPRPEVCVEAHITTEWTCWNCGADCDVWGVGEGFVPCSECGKESYL